MTSSHRSDPLASPTDPPPAGVLTPARGTRRRTGMRHESHPPFGRTRAHITITAALVGSLAVTACSSTAPVAKAQPSIAVPVIDPGDGGVYAPKLDPASFAAVIDNPFMPFRVGSHWRYLGKAAGETETIDVTVTGNRRTILGISTFEVRDTVTVGGKLAEDTYDWYAQDSAGNVWYFGEAVTDYESGRPLVSPGSWEAGVDGGLPGIVMPAKPVVGSAYRQEFLAGKAEDMVKILRVGGSLKVKAASSTDVVTTQDWTPLDAKTVEEKSYARGIGKVHETKTAGGKATVELVDYKLGA
jgi:hypothetical protein